MRIMAKRTLMNPSLLSSAPYRFLEQLKTSIVNGSTTVSTTPKLPSEITGKTVEEIIKDWNAELQERTGKFRKQANAIAVWDRRILQNRDVLLRLEIEAANVVDTQAKVELQLELIETHQQEIHPLWSRYFQNIRGLFPLLSLLGSLQF